MSLTAGVCLILITVLCLREIWQKRGGELPMSVIKIATCLVASVIGVFSLFFCSLYENELGERRSDIDNQTSSEIWKQGHLTNGAYAVLGVYPTRAGCLAMLQPVVIGEINFQTRTVVYTNVGRFPRLFSLDVRLRDPEDPDSSGLAEVYTGKLRSSVRDYLPFLQLPPKKSDRHCRQTRFALTNVGAFLLKAR
jgi:hypothetical protein